MTSGKSFKIKAMVAIAVLLFVGSGCQELPSTTGGGSANINAAPTSPTSTIKRFPANPAPTSVEAAPNGTYKNVDGASVPRPYAAPSAPAGASAQCRDGTYSFSQHRSGTCSHHGGVAEWL